MQSQYHLLLCVCLFNIAWLPTVSITSLRTHSWVAATEAFAQYFRTLLRNPLLPCISFLPRSPNKTVVKRKTLSFKNMHGAMTCLKLFSFFVNRNVDDITRVFYHISRRADRACACYNFIERISLHLKISNHVHIYSDFTGHNKNFTSKAKENDSSYFCRRFIL